MPAKKNPESRVDKAWAQDCVAPNEHRALQIDPFLVQCAGLDHGADGIETNDGAHPVSDATKTADGKISLDAELAGRWRSVQRCSCQDFR
jgi:hypothetical protein